MALLNYKKKEINAKIVYYGPGLSGKTTNIQHIHSKLRPDHKGKLMTLATQTDRTLFFDFLPVELGEIRGLKTRFQLYTVPGQVFYNATRKLVLKNVDGVVFVADSDPAHLADNIESFKNLEQNLKFHGRDVKEIPIVIQYNKRDLDNAMSIDDLQAKFNTLNLPYSEASAGNGKGVLETLTKVSKMVLQRLRDMQNITRVGDDAPDGTLPDPGIAPRQEAGQAEPKAAQEKPVDAVEPEVLDEDEPEVLADEIELETSEDEGLEEAAEAVDIEPEVDVSTEDEEDVLLEPPEDDEPDEAETTLSPETSPVASVAVKAPPGLVFDKVVSAQAEGTAVKLTLAFRSGDETVKAAIKLQLTPDADAEV